MERRDCPCHQPLHIVLPASISCINLNCDKMCIFRYRLQRDCKESLLLQATGFFVRSKTQRGSESDITVFNSVLEVSECSTANVHMGRHILLFKDPLSLTSSVRHYMRAGCERYFRDKIYHYTIFRSSVSASWRTMHTCIVIALLVFAACSTSSAQQQAGVNEGSDEVTSHRRNLLVTGTLLKSRFPPGMKNVGYLTGGFLDLTDDPVKSFCPPGGISLFGSPKSCVEISGNGLLSFHDDQWSTLPAFSPDILTQSKSPPLLAPFWGDADLTGSTLPLPYGLGFRVYGATCHCGTPPLAVRM